MAHPDEGYLLPENMDPEERDPNGQWDNSYRIDPETGEGFFAADPMECYRIALLRVRLDEERGIVRADREERLKRLEVLRGRAAYGPRKKLESERTPAEYMDVMTEDWDEL